MTGYGRGQSTNNAFKFTCEVSSVNRKQSEISLRIPAEFDGLEPRIRDEINALVSRGKLNVVITCQPLQRKSNINSHFNRPVIEGYVEALRKLKKEFKLTGDVSLDTLVRIPGALKPIGDSIDQEALWPQVKKALDDALLNLLGMRTKEGAFLTKDLVKRLALLKTMVLQIEKRSPEVVKNHRKNLHERIKNAGVDLAVDDERLVKEIVFFADRSDITEELTRLKSHFSQFSNALKEKTPVGRTLDFITQEMNREINTIGSKANDIIISQRVVESKAELEKIREQIQNIE